MYFKKPFETSLVQIIHVKTPHFNFRHTLWLSHRSSTTCSTTPTGNDKEILKSGTTVMYLERSDSWPRRAGTGWPYRKVTGMLIKVGDPLYLSFLPQKTWKKKKNSGRGEEGREKRIKQQQRCAIPLFCLCNIIHPTNQLLNHLKGIRHCARLVPTWTKGTCFLYGCSEVPSDLGTDKPNWYSLNSPSLLVSSAVRAHWHWVFSTSGSAGPLAIYSTLTESPTWSRPIYSLKQPLLPHKIKVQKWTGLVWKAGEIYRPDTTWSYMLISCPFDSDIELRIYIYGLALNQDLFSTLFYIMHDVQRDIFTAKGEHCC